MHNYLKIGFEKLNQGGLKMVFAGFGQSYVLILALIFGLLNISLVVWFLQTYWKVYQKIETRFTLGLMVYFTYILILNIFLILILGFVLTHVPVPELQTTVQNLTIPNIIFVVNLIQLLALIVLFIIIRE